MLSLVVSMLFPGQFSKSVRIQFVLVDLSCWYTKRPRSDDSIHIEVESKNHIITKETCAKKCKTNYIQAPSKGCRLNPNYRNHLEAFGRSRYFLVASVQFVKG